MIRYIAAILVSVACVAGSAIAETEMGLDPSGGRPCSHSSATRIGNFCQEDCQFNRNKSQCIKECCKKNRSLTTCPPKEIGLSICFRDACEAIAGGGEYGESNWDNCAKEYGKGKVELQSPEY